MSDDTKYKIILTYPNITKVLRTCRTLMHGIDSLNYLNQSYAEFRKTVLCILDEYQFANKNDIFKRNEELQSDIVRLEGEINNFLADVENIKVVLGGLLELKLNSTDSSPSIKNDF